MILFGGKILEGNYKSLKDYDIKKESTLHFTLQLKGGSPGVYFSDLEERYFVDFSKAPKWRIVSKGLNLEGKCINKSCEANDKRVWVQMGIGTFDIIRKTFELKCPSCNQCITDVNNVGFWDCKYVINGMQIKPELKPIQKENNAPKEQFLTFYPNEVKLAYLTIETKSTDGNCSII